MNIGTEKPLKVYRISVDGYPMCAPIDGSNVKIMLKPRPGESNPNALGLNVGDGVYARVTGRPSGAGFYISTLYASTMAAFEKMMKPGQSFVQPVVASTVPIPKVEPVIQKKPAEYSMRAILHDTLANMFLCIGTWEPGKGPENAIQTERYGTIRVNGLQYSWALRKVEKGETGSRVSSLIELCEHPEIIRHARWPGKCSTTEKPTSLLETIRDMKEGEPESELLRYILGLHLTHQKPAEYSISEKDIEFKGHIGFSLNRCAEGQ